MAKKRPATAKIIIRASLISGSVKNLNFRKSLMSRKNNDFDRAKTKNTKIIPSIIKIFGISSLSVSKPDVEITDIAINKA